MTAGNKNDSLKKMRLACLMFAHVHFGAIFSRYDDEGMTGLIDKRLGQVSERGAPVDEVIA